MGPDLTSAILSYPEIGYHKIKESRQFTIHDLLGSRFYRNLIMDCVNGEVVYTKDFDDLKIMYPSGDDLTTFKKAIKGSLPRSICYVHFIRYPELKC